MKKAFNQVHKNAPTNHKVKQHIIVSYSIKFNLNTFIETGTFLGEMVSVMRFFFGEIYSIELSSKLATSAKEQFKKERSIRIIEGDSSIALTDLLPNINKPVLFWLDGHFSGGQTALGDKECPVLEELDAIAQFKFNNNSVILIDDARLFTGAKDYPELKTIKAWVTATLPKHMLSIAHDIIQIIPET